jgi:hypothetical protein
LPRSAGGRCCAVTCQGHPCWGWSGRRSTPSCSWPAQVRQKNAASKPRCVENNRHCMGLRLPALRPHPGPFPGSNPATTLAAPRASTEAEGGVLLFNLSGMAQQQPGTGLPAPAFYLPAGDERGSSRSSNGAAGNAGCGCRAVAAFNRLEPALLATAAGGEVKVRGLGVPRGGGVVTCVCRLAPARMGRRPPTCGPTARPPSGRGPLGADPRAGAACCPAPLSGLRRHATAHPKPPSAFCAGMAPPCHAAARPRRWRRLPAARGTSAGLLGAARRVSRKQLGARPCPATGLQE